MRFIESIKSKMSKLGKRVDNYQEAITFAQAGEYDHADRLLGEENPEKQDMEKLLVIGDYSSFPSDLVSYSLEMAKRLSYDILAMNTSPVSEEQKQTFLLESGKSGEAFRQMAEDQGVRIQHIVKFTDVEQAIKEAQAENGKIAFVVSEGRTENQAAKRDENTNRPRKECFVYSMT